MKKKIAHVTFNMNVGGAEQVICNLVRFADRSVYDVSVICLDSPVGPLGRKLREEGCPVVSFKRRPGFDLLLVKEIARLVEKERIDVLHCHQYTPYVYGLFAGLAKRVKVIFTEHGRFHPDRRRIKRVLINPLLGFCTDRIISISSATRDALVTYENFPRKYIDLIYNGVQDPGPVSAEERFRLRLSLGIGPSDPILGTVARLDPIKNQQMMLKALGTIHKVFPETFLIIVGDGPERQRLEALSEELGLEAKVIFTGYQVEVHRYLQAMDVFLLTSFSEGTAMTLLEAMSCALPVAATAVGGNTEIVLDEQTGFLVPSDDASALALKIISLLQDVGLRARLGRNGRQRFLNHFSVDGMVRSYQAIYG